jgi:LacI family transcriptional regulator
MATIKDIAHRLGIATSTVSKGLNGANDISEDLRQQVLDTAIEMGYKTKKMKKDEHKKLCILIENMNYEEKGDFGYALILGFKQMAIRDHWEVDVVPCNATMQKNERYDSFMLSNGYSGALLLGFTLQDDWILQCKTTGYPTILFDNYIEKNPHVGYVGTDSSEGIRDAIDYLHKKGHQNIGFLNGTPNSMISSERHDVFELSIKDQGLPYNPDLNIYGFYSRECGHLYVPTFLENNITAIICGSDEIALGVIDAINEQGYLVPQNISVIGFDDLPIAKQAALTSIRQERKELGKCAYFAINNLLRKVPISKTLIRSRLIKRDSVGTIK